MQKCRISHYKTQTYLRANNKLLVEKYLLATDEPKDGNKDVAWVGLRGANLCNFVVFEEAVFAV